MYLTREIVESLVSDPENFGIVNRTDHAEWFGGMKAERTFDFAPCNDVWTDRAGIVFETTKGLFASSPEGKVFKVNLSVPVGLTGNAMRVTLRSRER